jgi:outer membrane protein
MLALFTANRLLLARVWAACLPTPNSQEFHHRMFSKSWSMLVLATAFAGSVASAPAQAIAPAKVAIINAQKSVADTADIKKAQAALEAKYRPRTQAIDNLQKELGNIQQQLGAANIDPNRAAQLRADGTVKQKELQRLSEDLQSDVNNERQDILGRAGRQMTDIVKKIAEERGIDVVIDISNTLYFKPTLDLTAEATAAYDKAFPAR